MMAATLAEGKTTITNAASEPEIVDVGRCLQQMGARLTGWAHAPCTLPASGNWAAPTIPCLATVLRPAHALAVGASGGSVDLTGITGEELGALLPAMRLAGAGDRKRHRYAACFTVSGPEGRPNATPVTTEPYPGFATDLQAPFMGLMCNANGVSRIRETILKIASCTCRNWCGWVPIFRWKATRPLLQGLTRFTARPSWRPICGLPSRW